MAENQLQMPHGWAAFFEVDYQKRAEMLLLEVFNLLHQVTCFDGDLFYLARFACESRVQSSCVRLIGRALIQSHVPKAHEVFVHDVILLIFTRFLE